MTKKLKHVNIKHKIAVRIYWCCSLSRIKDATVYRKDLKKMSFFVIEGDNGTGKDTLAIKLQKKFGFRIVTNEEDIIKLNKEAKKFIGNWIFFSFIIK